MTTQAELDQHFMCKALEFAAQGEAIGEVPVGAIIVKDNKIIGTGFNQPIFSHDPTAHAEIIALRDASAYIKNYRLNNCTLYVTIEPCTMCAGSLIHARISRLVFGAKELKSGSISSNGNILKLPHFNHQIDVTSGVLKKECAMLMRHFFSGRRSARKIKFKKTNP